MVTVLKLGGSVLTEKDREATLAAERLETIAATLGGADLSGHVLVLGGGSFGHPPAERHGMSAQDGTRDPAAVAEVHGAMLDLASAVVTRLVGAGVPAVPLHPLSMAARSAIGFDLAFDPIETALAEGFVPVLHGDGVLTEDRGVTILSGDDLVLGVAQMLRAERVGLCSDVPGVLDGSGDVIERIEGFGQVEGLVGASDATDVTGGMARKVRVLLGLGTPASIFDLDALETFLAGGWPGTTVEASGDAEAGR